MKKEGLKAVSGRKKRKISVHSLGYLKPSENVLNQDFKVEKKNAVWVSDITYIKTNTGWIYLAAVIDLWSRKVVGWSIEKHMQRSLALNALKMAINTRKVSDGLIHHSDQGTQYTSYQYQQFLRQSHFISSMNRRGNCLDNAVVESFFSSLKKELVYPELVKALPSHIVKTKVLNYIHWYNSKRLHSTLNHMSPVDYELKHHTMSCVS